MAAAVVGGERKEGRKEEGNQSCSDVHKVKDDQDDDDDGPFSFQAPLLMDLEFSHILKFKRRF